MTHTVDVELARRVLEQIVAAPRRWDQSTWLSRPYEPDDQAPTDTVDNCQTSGCFAGWAVVLAGYKTRVGTPLNVDAPTRERINTTYGYGLSRTAWQPPVTVQTVAAVRLGLTVAQAEELFDGTNSLTRLYDLLNEFTDGDIAVPTMDELPVWADMNSDELFDYWEAIDEAAEDT